MYSRSTRIIFSFMAFVMGVGYIVLVLSGVPSFQQAFSPSGSARGFTQKQLEGARATVDRLGCREGMRNRGAVSRCVGALEDMAAAYRALATPEDDATEAVPNADHYLDRMLSAYRLRAQLKPDDLEIQSDYAGALAQMGKPKEALLIFRDLSQREPDDADYAAAYADTAQSAGESSEATRAWKSFIKRFPNDANVESAREQLKTLKEQPSSTPVG